MSLVAAWARNGGRGMQQMGLQTWERSEWGGSFIGKKAWRSDCIYQGSLSAVCYQHFWMLLGEAGLLPPILSLLLPALSSFCISATSWLGGAFDSLAGLSFSDFHRFRGSSSCLTLSHPSLGPYHCGLLCLYISLSQGGGSRGYWHV